MADLDIYSVTFNCGRKLIKPEAFASHFFDGLPDTTTHTQPPGLIVLYLQEVALLAEAFNGYALPQYYDRFKVAVNLAVKQRFPEDAISYLDFLTDNLGLTAIMVFIRSDIQHRIGNVMKAGVGVGYRKVGNKGAVGVRISWLLSDNTMRNEETMNLTFISAHLAPSEEALDRRNQDFADIVAGLVFQQPGENEVNEWEQAPLLSTDSDEAEPNTNSSLIGMYASDTHVFFAGDLNYRTSSTPPAHDGSDTNIFPKLGATASDPNHWTKLLERDQLTTQLRANRTLHGLTESPINFPPTYKYSDKACQGQDVATDSELKDWHWSSHRWPSWCDRILYAQPSSPSTQVTVKKYTSLPLLQTSDHRPVALSTSVPLRPVQNPEFAAKRPVEIDPAWRANRDAARWKEVVVSTVWGSVSTVDGALNLSVGLAAVVCLAIFASVYAREW